MGLEESLEHRHERLCRGAQLGLGRGGGVGQLGPEVLDLALVDGELGQLGRAEDPHGVDEALQAAQQVPVASLRAVRRHDVGVAEVGLLDVLDLRSDHPAGDDALDRQVQVRVATEHRGEGEALAPEVALADEAGAEDRASHGCLAGVGRDRPGEGIEDLGVDLARVAPRPDREAVVGR